MCSRRREGGGDREGREGAEEAGLEGYLLGGNLLQEKKLERQLEEAVSNSERLQRQVQHYKAVLSDTVSTG